MRIRTVFVLLVLTGLLGPLFTPSASAQQTQKRSEVEFLPVEPPTERVYRPWDPYTLSVLLEFGGQVADVSGNHEVYAAHQNYRDGFKIFNFNIRGQGQPEAFLTDFYVEGTGWVNEPYSYLRFGASKNKWFDFRSTFRQSDYDWFFPGFARSQHFDQIDRRLQDYRLTLFSAIAWCMIHLRPRYSMPLLATVMFALVQSLGRTAEYGATPLGFINLIHLAVESSILMMAMLYIRVSDRDARDFSSRLLQESRLDAVTRLPNLNAIKHRLLSAPPARRELACLLLDKTDTLAPGFGLATQTRLMNRVATHLADIVEPYYIGTSQFALLARDEAGDDVWDRLIARVEGLEVESDGQPLRLLPYLGVAACPPQAPGGVDHALMLASSLAYEARRRNELRPLYATDTGVSPRLEQRLFEAAEALACLRNERVVLHFQPIRALSATATSRLAEAAVHGEVLCRLRNVDGTLLKPDIFMRAIEGAGRGVELDLAVLRALFDWLRRNPDAAARAGRIAVNLTGQSLTSAGFAKQLLAMLDDAPLPLSKLCFEIIETAAIVSPAETHAFLGRLRRLGCSVAIDDFGVGMQSFERLKELPVDVIKIDGSFIRNLTQRGKDYALVQASVAVAHAFGAMTVAEYVEDEATVECLRELGVDWMQGYLISRPVPIGDAFGLIDETA